MLISMSRTCSKCKNSIPDTEQLGPVNEKYPTCTKCWAEWKEYHAQVSKWETDRYLTMF